jgi:transketolase
LDRFLSADTAARAAVIPVSVRRRVAVEAGRTFGWGEVVGDAGAVIGIDRFGESAPGADLATHFGFTVDAVYAVAVDQLAGS